MSSLRRVLASDEMGLTPRSAELCVARSPRRDLQSLRTTLCTRYNQSSSLVSIHMCLEKVRKKIKFLY